MDIRLHLLYPDRLFYRIRSFPGRLKAKFYYISCARIFHAVVARRKAQGFSFDDIRSVGLQIASGRVLACPDKNVA
jgi:hypothetical protein